MRQWLIRQDRPDGGIVCFDGTPAFRAQWTLNADAPKRTATQHPRGETSWWVRTGDDEDDIVVQFFNIDWQAPPPSPEEVQSLIASAAKEIDEQVGERF